MSNTIELPNSQKCGRILRLATRFGHKLCLRGEYNLSIYPPKDGANQDLVDLIKKNKTSLIEYLIPLQKTAGEDWVEIVSDSEKLESFMDVISRQCLIDQQRVPKDYATLILCRTCGVVSGESDEVGRTVLGCPWCHVPNKRNRYLLNQWSKQQYKITLNDMKSGGLRRPWKSILASPALLTQLAIETQKIKRFSIR